MLPRVKVYCEEVSILVLYEHDITVKDFLITLNKRILDAKYKFQAHELRIDDAVVLRTDLFKDVYQPPSKVSAICTRNERARKQIGRAVQQECRDRSRMPSSA
eukprot:TRINITY_DN24502_c0_g1_i4.p1 TRINITY_DN24502_c0_g1~~TRINITY_DN24502_c0_g1_i4.p1  ORF type:complete len:103 (-),score=10.12 TRINITY_DN24502_c0_g1_i4:10-318(-)